MIAGGVYITLLSDSDRLPPNEQFGLSAQIRRASVSIPSNIAEGQASGPGRRNLYHVRIALGSLAELETQLEIARRLRLISEEDVKDISAVLARTGQLLNGMARSLRLHGIGAAAADRRR